MKIRLSELRETIRNIVSECYGWPVENEIPLYGIANIDKAAANSKITNTRLPKGANSKTNLGESFKRVTQKELSAWKSGDLGYESVNEEVEINKDPCDSCNEMFPPTELVNVDEKYLCKDCSEK